MRTRIKFCGMRRREDIEAVNRIHPDYAGFICTERFWRYIPPEKAAELKNMLDPSIRAVGVFVDEPYEKIARYLGEGIIDIVQLHGHEDESYIRELRDVMKAQHITAPIITAFKVRTEEDIAQAERSTADYILLDNGTGTGEKFDWKLIRDIGRDYFLAGGLTPDNVGGAVDRFHPFAVDMSSGLETERVKDSEKMKRAAEEVRKNDKS